MTLQDKYEMRRLSSNEFKLVHFLRLNGNILKVPQIMIAKDLGISVRTVRDAFENLRVLNVVSYSRVANKAKLYKLNDFTMWR